MNNSISESSDALPVYILILSFYVFRYIFRDLTNNFQSLLDTSYKTTNLSNFTN